MSIKLIVGLGNPGSVYSGTRHNVGVWFVHALAHSFNVSFKSEKKLHGQVATFAMDQDACRLFIPSTFMNESGIAVRAIANFYQIKPQEILIVHDELDLDVGRIKLKSGGGHGGHNGLRDILRHLGSSDFNRLRIGIGHPGHKQFVVNYVLKNPGMHEKESILKAIDRAVDVIPLVIKGDMALAMNSLNG